MRDTPLSTRAVAECLVAVAAAIGALSLVATASAQTPVQIDDPPVARQVPTQVAPPPTKAGARVVPIFSHFGGITVWNEADVVNGQQRFFLAAQKDGNRFRLPIEPREVPFDVDLGPHENFDVVAAYSRCQEEPTAVFTRNRFGARVFSQPYPAYTTGRGCDIYRFEFKTMSEFKLPGASTNQASEVLPSIWRNEVAFARVYEQRAGFRGRIPYLYVRATSTADTVRSNRQPGGRRGQNGLPGPTRLDLYGRRLSFVWNYSTGVAERGETKGVTEVRLDTVDGPHLLLSQATFEISKPRGTYASFAYPNGSRGRIFYGFQRVLVEPEDTKSVTSILLRYSISRRDKALSDAPASIVDTVTEGGDTYVGLTDNYFANPPFGHILRFHNVTYRD